MAAIKDITIEQGRTFALSVRWETGTIVYKPITGISNTAPVRITASGHGVPDGWRVAATGVLGMTEINAEANAVKSKDYHQATYVDANTVELNEVNAASFKAYVSGGYLQYNLPADLTGFIGRMEIRDKVGGTLLASTDAADSPLNILNVAVDAAKHLITITITAAHTTAITWKSGVYDLEMVSPDAEPVITALFTGKVSVTREVTT